jgi:hypothetical protein
VCYSNARTSDWSFVLQAGDNDAMPTTTIQTKHTQHVQQPSALETNDERRLRKLNELINGLGGGTEGRVELARRAGVNETYVRQIVAGTPTPKRPSRSDKPEDAKEERKRSVGDDMARKIEAGMGLPRGWMDNDPPPQVGAAGDHLTVPLVLEIVDTLALRFDQMREPVSHGMFATVVRGAVASIKERSGMAKASVVYEALIQGMKAGLREAARKP